MTRTLAALVWTLIAALGLAGTPRLAFAAPVAADAVAAEEGLLPAADARAQLAAALAREDVARALRERGVDPAAVAARVEALDDEQARQLAQQIDSAPAGADSILGTIVFIFVLLLVTDILGLTKVFPFTRSVR